MNITFSAPLFFLSLIVISACQGVQTSSAADLAADAAIQRGATLYEQNCVSCHGAGLAGGQAPSMADDNWEYGGTDADILKAINEGIEEAGMPEFNDALTQTDKQDLLAYIRGGASLKTTAPIDDVPSVEDQVLIQDWATDLDEPWGVEFIGPDTALVTEKSGKLWQVSSTARMDVTGIPVSVDKRQGGLLDVAVDPDYSENGWVYLSFTHADDDISDNLMTKLVRGKIAAKGSALIWTQEETLFQAKAEHYIATGFHFGSRITFDDKGHLFFGIGDRGKKDMAQDLSKPNGKIHRIMRDGTIPKDNPFVDNSEAYASIFSYGNRNPQGTIVHPETQAVWETEHGPKGGDELNIIKAGVNYGWPKISYGRNYSGTVLTPHTALPGMAQPVSQWTPSIAVCGLDVYTGDLFPSWKGRLMAGALANQTVRLIELDDERYLGEAVLIKDKGRVRDVTTGWDGAIYVALPDKIVRLSPAQ